MKTNSHLRLATAADEPRPAVTAGALQEHRASLASLLRSASTIANRPDLLSAREMLAIRTALAAIEANVGALRTMAELDQAITEVAA